jgi:hypothetical protein
MDFEVPMLHARMADRTSGVAAFLVQRLLLEHASSKSSVWFIP